MNFKSIEEVFESFNHLKVLIIGDVMIDSYLWGKVERISPEAPVPVVQVKNREKRLGGAANVAMNIRAMGAEAILCAVIGEDDDAQTFFKLLEENNLSKEGILQSPERITTIKHRILSGHQHLLRVDSEMTTVIKENERTLLLDKIEALLPKIDVIIFQDYDKGTISPELIEVVVTKATEKNIPTVVDPKKQNFLSYHKATLFKPNLKELKEGLQINFDVNNMEELKKAVEQLKHKLSLEQALITLSERGVYIDSENEEYHIPAHVRTIADVSGAGDTVISVASLALALNLPAKMLAHLSNLSGGLVCEYVGVVSIDKQKLLEEAIKNHIFEL